MPARIEFHPAADRDLTGAVSWYFERSERAASALLREVERGLAIVAENPELWPKINHAARKYVLSKYPYYLIYRVVGESVVLIALAHERQRPEFWSDR